MKLPTPEPIAPSEDGGAEALWTHPSLTRPSRLLVTRDGDALIPATSNLPPWIDATTTIDLPRGAQGIQEDATKSAQAFAYVDRMSDRGVESTRADDCVVPDPEWTQLLNLREQLYARGAALSAERELRKRRPLHEITLDAMVIGLRLTIVRGQPEETPHTVPRYEVGPDARQVTLKVPHLRLVPPLKNGLENGRRWLATALAPRSRPQTMCGFKTTAFELLRPRNEHPARWGSTRFASTSS